MHQMQDGFSKVYMQLEALDERLQDVQAIGDKVDSLEASVRLLENHACLWPMVGAYGGGDPDGQSSVSSSSLHSMSTPAITTVTPAGAPVSSMMIKQRSLPKRNHTISSIKYDSSAYKVSFNLGGDVEDAFRDHEGGHEVIKFVAVDSERGDPGRPDPLGGGVGIHGWEAKHNWDMATEAATDRDG